MSGICNREEDLKGSLQWLFAEPVASPIDIGCFCAARSVKLPSGVIDFLACNNAGSPSRPGFKTIDGAEQLFNNLLSYNDGDPCHISTALEALGDYPHLYPIGRDPFGNLICLDTTTSTAVFFDHETDEVIPIDTESNSELFAWFAGTVTEL